MLSHSVMFDSLRPHGLQPAKLLCPKNFSGKNTGVGCHCPPQGIFPIQGLNPCLWCLLHQQADSLPLRHLRSPGFLLSGLRCHLLREALLNHLLNGACQTSSISSHAIAYYPVLFSSQHSSTSEIILFVSCLLLLALHQNISSQRKDSLIHFLSLESQYLEQFLIYSSVHFSRSVMSDSLRPHESWNTKPPCPSPTLGVHSDSGQSSQ